MVVLYKVLSNRWLINNLISVSQWNVILVLRLLPDLDLFLTLRYNLGSTILMKSVTLSLQYIYFFLLHLDFSFLLFYLSLQKLNAIVVLLLTSFVSSIAH